jgi:hypothetical protein
LVLVEPLVQELVVLGQMGLIQFFRQSLQRAVEVEVWAVTHPEEQERLVEVVVEDNIGQLEFQTMLVVLVMLVVFRQSKVMLVGLVVGQRKVEAEEPGQSAKMPLVLTLKREDMEGMAVLVVHHL